MVAGSTPCAIHGTRTGVLQDPPLSLNGATEKVLPNEEGSGKGVLQWTALDTSAIIVTKPRA